MYERIGSYDGPEPLESLAQRMARFDIAWAPDGHGTTVEHRELIRDAYRDDLACAVPGIWAYSMLVALKPGGNIPWHNDLPQEAGLTRYHVVLQTNSRCWNFHDGDWQQLELGGVYTMDPVMEHASINWGETDRIHLVVDVMARVLEGVTA